MLPRRNARSIPERLVLSAFLFLIFIRAPQLQASCRETLALAAIQDWKEHHPGRDIFWTSPMEINQWSILGFMAHAVESYSSEMQVSRPAQAMGKEGVGDHRPKWNLYRSQGEQPGDLVEDVNILHGESTFVFHNTGKYRGEFEVLYLDSWGNLRRRLPTGSDEAFATDILPEDRTFTAVVLKGNDLMLLASDGSIRVWDLATQQIVEVLDAHPWWTATAISNGTKYWAQLDVNDFTVFGKTESAQQRIELYKIVGLKIKNFTFSPKDTYVLLVLADGSGMVLDAKTGNDVVILGKEGTQHVFDHWNPWMHRVENP